MARGESDRNLLFGVLSFHTYSITRDGLIRAMNAWVLEKGQAAGPDPGRARDLSSRTSPCSSR